jgi:secreted trypsin-like serine protease
MPETGQRRRLALALLAAAGAAGCGDAGVPPAAEPVPGEVDVCSPEVGESAQASLGGEIDAEDPAVVAVNTLDIDCTRAGAPACTGTLVAPDVVLTAAHCVGEYPPEAFGVLFGAQADAGRGPLGSGLDGSFFRVIGVRVHPEFDPIALLNDVALLQLEAEPAVPPARLAAPMDASIVGAQARIVGFGLAEGEPAYAKRRGTVAVTAASPQEITYGSDPSMTCSGDSGGPVFLTVQGLEVLIGVTSRGDPACADHGVGIRVDALPSDFFDAAW